MELRFRSKVDRWLVAPVAVGFLVPVILLLRGLATGRLTVVAAVVLLIISFGIASLVVPTYAVTDDSIVVRRGFLRSSMPLARVRQLRATREALASPALSLDRIEIRTDRGLWLFVSPADRPGFVRAVQRRHPSIEVVGLALEADMPLPYNR